MEDFRREFLREAVSTLKNISESLRRPDASLTGENLREVFRRIHSIKGTAQTLGFQQSGQIAHDIESLLQALQDEQIEQAKVMPIVKTGITLLHASFVKPDDDSDAEATTEFRKELYKLLPEISSTSQAENLHLAEVPSELIARLSKTETAKLAAAIRSGRWFLLLEVFFKLADFDNEYKILRNLLEQKGEIIASSAAPPDLASGTIAFQIYFATNSEAAEISEILSQHDALIKFEVEPQPTSIFDLGGVFENAANTGSKVAQMLGKVVDVETSHDDIDISDTQLKGLSEILLHLIRNCADHGIESPTERIESGKPAAGKIKIDLRSNENRLLLTVSDDGRGIDTAQIIHTTDAGNEIEALDLLFSYGFSTKQTVSEISGRGVGLDVVKTLAEKAGGKIKIKTSVGEGTSFIVTLPKK